MTAKMIGTEGPETSRIDLLKALKERVRGITNSRDGEPVYLKNISVLDATRSCNGQPVYLQLNSIFCDEGGTLCGDLIASPDSFNGGIIFGQSIEALSVEDLKNVMDNLEDESWSVVLSSRRDEERRRKGGISLFGLRRRYATGA